MARCKKKTYLDAHGMKNKGNTCFFNAAIQCFISIPPIVNFYLNTVFEEKSQPISLAFQNFIFKYKLEKSVDTSEFISCLKRKIDLFDGKQQDSHAFLESFISLLHAESSKLPQNIIDELFEIKTQDVITCHSCNYRKSIQSKMLVKFLSLKKSVQASVNSFISERDEIDIESPWTCEKCKNKVAASITHEIVSTSDYAIIFLNRFLSKIQKNTNSIFLDQKLNLKGEYELFGYVCHSGSLFSGHYYAEAKRDEWNEYNDSLVNAITPSESSSHAYILFYKRI